MKKMFASTFALMFAATAPVGAQVVQVTAPVAGATTVTFESLALNAQASAAFAGLGVTVSGVCFITSNFSSAGFGVGNSRQAGNIMGGDFCAGAPATGVTFTFAAPISYFGLFGVSNASFEPSGPGHISLTSTHGAVTIATTDFFNPDQSGAHFAGFTDAMGFSSVTVTADQNGVFGVDNISFKAASAITTAPEPATMALFGLGMLTLGALKRRKRSIA